MERDAVNIPDIHPCRAAAEGMDMDTQRLGTAPAPPVSAGVYEAGAQTEGSLSTSAYLLTGGRRGGTTAEQTSPQKVREK